MFSIPAGAPQSNTELLLLARSARDFFLIPAVINKATKTIPAIQPMTMPAIYNNCQYIARDRRSHVLTAPPLKLELLPLPLTLAAATVEVAVALELAELAVVLGTMLEVDEVVDE